MVYHYTIGHMCVNENGVYGDVLRRAGYSCLRRWCTRRQKRCRCARLRWPCYTCAWGLPGRCRCGHGVPVRFNDAGSRGARRTPPRHDQGMSDEWRRDRGHRERLDSSSASCYQGAEIPRSRFYLRPSGRLEACRATRMGSPYSPRPQARAPLGPPGQAWASDRCRRPCTVMQRSPCGHSRRGQPLWHRRSLEKEDT